MKRKLITALLLTLLICKGSQAQVINTIAGGVGNGGQATAAVMSAPFSVATDRMGNTYFIDLANNMVRKVNAAGVISIVAGTQNRGYSSSEDNQLAVNAQLNYPNAVACDTLGNVYIADNLNHRIRKVTTAGIISTFAGGGSSYAEGSVASAAKFDYPSYVATDLKGNVYVCDESRNRVKKITPSGYVFTVAGKDTAGYSGDGGPASLAKLKLPGFITVDKTGNLYIADRNNYRVRKVDTNGIITTFAGNGSTGGLAGDGGAATAAVFNGINGLAADTSGNIYITDKGNNLIRKVSTTGIITRVAGTFVTGGFAGDGGADTFARLNEPGGIAFDNAGNHYIADYSNHRIRKVNTSHTITTFAGNGFTTSQGFYGDGGPAISALMNNASAVAVDTSGNVYVADQQNNLVRKISRTGIITTFAGTPGYNGFSGDGGPATNAEFNYPSSVTADAKGNIFICDRQNSCIRKVNNAGIITRYAGIGSYGFSGDGGNATAAELNNPYHIAIDKVGNLYIADYGNNRVRKVDTNMTITTLAGNGTSGYFGDGGMATNAQIIAPVGMAIDDTGNIYLTAGNRIRKITASGIIFTLAGNGTNGYAGDGGPASAAVLYNPGGITVDKRGNIYVNDAGNGYIRKITTAGIILRYAGSTTGGSAADGIPATFASISSSFGMTIDSAGNLYLPGGGNNNVRKISGSGIQISANHDTICAGSAVRFTAAVSNAFAITPSYQWQKNGSNVGTDSSSWTTTTLNAGDVVRCLLYDGSGGVLQAISDVKMITVQSLTPAISFSVSPSTTVCKGTTVTSNALPVSGGTTPTYQWEVDGIAVAGATDAVYSFTPSATCLLGCKMRSNIACRLYDTAIYLTQITVNDTGRPAVVVLTNTGDTVCSSLPVTCTAIGFTSGSSPSFTWYLNGASKGTGTSYTFHPSNGDIVFCEMGNLGTCVTVATVTSPSHTFTVLNSATATITIAAEPGQFLRKGKEVTCTATSTNGGTAPVYEWYNGGGLLYTGNPYKFTLNNDDNIYCKLTSNAPCAGSATSGTLAFVIDTSAPPPPVIPDDAYVYPNPNKGSFTLKQPIDGPDGMDVYTAIYNILGQPVYKETLIVSNKMVTADVSLGRSLPEGVYLVSFTTFTSKSSRRFVIKY